ncbi:YrhB domain-containing protein [uncultured Devosia sp.]|uniref:YrhB domain-containing protein n=1 Tax=uncultured Devosia sp. TaxID=211434 RepID=UPI002626C403|nr:YrhB domain-containing protein [uncultured Devosia sp.]
MAKPYGWVFFCVSKDSLTKPDDISNRLAGNAPFVVDRDSGEITLLGTALPTTEYLQRFEANLPAARMYRKPEQPVWT